MYVAKTKVLNSCTVTRASLAKLAECRTLDCKVAGLILTRGSVLCP